MSIGQPGQEASQSLCLHPSVGTAVSPARLTPRQKVAAVAKIRCLEHDLFDGNRVSRSLTRVAADGLVSQINELRQALGWLEIDPKGQWRWPHDHEVAPTGAPRPQLTAIGATGTRPVDAS